MLIFRKSTSVEPAARSIADTIGQQLADGKRVLWLVPGGSAIAVALQAAALLQDAPLTTLTVSLTDERYGEVGHPDSNWQQLMERGFVLPGATLQPVLTGQGTAETVNQLSVFLQLQLAAVDYAIGLFGIGADGHTAGILPSSPAVETSDFAYGYQTEPYYRITMTAPAITRLDEAVVFAMGEQKRPVLDQLETDMPIDQQPAQVLKRVPRLVIYNEHKGGAA